MEFQFSYDKWYRLLAVPVGLGPDRAVLRIADNVLHVQMGWAFKADIPLTSVTNAKRGGHRFLDGLGVHGRRGTWLVNGSPKNIVELAIAPSVQARGPLGKIDLTTLRVSVADPDSLIAACTSGR